MTEHGPFQSNLAHLQAELGLLKLRLSSEVQRTRNRIAAPIEEEFRGLVVSDNRIDTILGDQDAEKVELGPTLTQLKQREEEVAAQRCQSLNNGVSLRLERLRRLFQLSDFDIGVIIICLAPELDLRYELLYAYLHEDVGKKRPTIDLALRVLCADLEERVERRQSFVHLAPLSKHNLVQLGEDPYNKDSTFLGRPLRIEHRIVDYLLESDAVDPALRACARVVRPTTAWSDVVVRPEIKDQLEQLAKKLRHAPGDEFGVVLQLVGPAGIGKKTLAQALCGSLNRNLLMVDGAGLLHADSTPEDLITRSFREARLQDAVICVNGFQVLQGDDAKAQALLASFAKAVAERVGLSIIAGESRWRPQSDLDGQSLLTLELQLPDYSEREILWHNHLGKQASNVPEREIVPLVSKFRFSGGQIQRAIATAADLARWRSGGRNGITAEDLHASSRGHSNQRLELLAHRIFPRYGWEDIVLPPDQKGQLKEICNRFENMPVVYGAWGFQSKTDLGKGLNILFAGPSGTGKTMSAEIMAGQLGLDLYKIDLSTIVSKYIGETEKNLDRIFREAQDSNAILFFDEADAIFGKRSEVRDAHDRYANIEISYLLQKMEEYQGITILTTNFRKNMDDAFVRRLHFAVEFPFPEEEYRLQIWQRVFPTEAPVDTAVDLRFLSRQFKVAGGNIKNIAVTAAFLAAQEQQSIGMEHVIQATKREYQKMGKLLVESDFEQYFGLVKG